MNEKMAEILMRRGAAMDGFPRYSTSELDADQLIVHDIPWLLERVEELAEELTLLREAVQPLRGAVLSAVDGLAKEACVDVTHRFQVSLSRAVSAYDSLASDAALARLEGE